MESKRTSIAPIYEDPGKIEITRKFKLRGKTPILPEEIIAEILAWLPVKALLKFRSVSKSWLSLISSPHFIETHFKNSIENPNFERHMVVTTIMRPKYILKLCSLRSLLYESVPDGVNYEFPLEFPNNSFRVAGICNGILCVIIEAKHFFLWNPSTREVHKLPDIDEKLTKSFIVTKFGFGYDESSNDYKVFGVMSVFWYYGKYESRAKVYSLKNNSWKRVDSGAAGSPFDNGGKFVNGKLHWGRRAGVDHKWEIVSFDLGSEESGMVEQPNYGQGCSGPLLGVINGCLSVVCDSEDSRADVWVMKQYGKKESWNKVASIPCYDCPLYGVSTLPLSIGLKGEILCSFGQRFLIYDPNNNSFRHPRTVNVDEFFEADVYVESLVSPFYEG